MSESVYVTFRERRVFYEWMCVREKRESLSVFRVGEKSVLIKFKWEYREKDRGKESWVKRERERERERGKTTANKGK